VGCDHLAETRDGEFDYGLDLVLDQLELRLAAQG